MVQILNFNDAMQGRATSARQKADSAKLDQAALDDDSKFWPEVSSGLWVSEGAVSPDPRNSPQQVFKEVLLILGGAGLLVLLSTVFLGAPQ